MPLLLVSIINDLSFSISFCLTAVHMLLIAELLSCCSWQQNVRSRPQYASSTFILMTTFPSVELTDETRTIGDAKLNNANVVQRMKWIALHHRRQPDGMHTV